MAMAYSGGGKDQQMNECPFRFLIWLRKRRHPTALSNLFMQKAVYLNDHWKSLGTEIFSFASRSVAIALGGLSTLYQYP